MTTLTDLGRRRRPLRQPLPDPGSAEPRVPGRGHERGRRHAAGRRGPGPGGRPGAQPGDVRDHLDGARGAADHRRQPAPQLHRPRGVPAHGRDRAALHPDARRPLPRPRRDDRRPHPGLVRGDHARRAVAEVELAQAARGGRGSRRPARTSSSAATCTSSGRSSAATSTSSRGSSRSQPGKYTIGPDDVAAARRREHDRRGRRPRHDVHRPQGRHRRHQRPAACGSRPSAASTSRCTSTPPAAASSGRSSTRTRRGTSGSSRCGRSTSPGTSSGSSTRASAG